jgi:hypothetical protein
MLLLGCSNSESSTSLLPKIFKKSWYGSFDREGGNDYAKNVVQKSSPVTFPKSFSRYSTIDEEKKSFNAKCSDSGDKSETVKYLVLCRVIVGKCFVTSKEYHGFPYVDASCSYDSMYNPSQEEYLLLNGENVLPEFFIQFNYQKSPQGPSPVPVDDDGLGAAVSRGLIREVVRQPDYGFDVDLSRPDIKLPPLPVVLLRSGLDYHSQLSYAVNPAALSSLYLEVKSTEEGERDRRRERESDMEKVCQSEASTPWDKIKYNSRTQISTIVEAINIGYSSYWNRVKDIQRMSRERDSCTDSRPDVHGERKSYPIYPKGRSLHQSQSDNQLTLSAEISSLRNNLDSLSEQRREVASSGGVSRGPGKVGSNPPSILPPRSKDKQKSTR